MTGSKLKGGHGIKPSPLGAGVGILRRRVREYLVQYYIGTLWFLTEKLSPDMLVRGAWMVTDNIHRMIMLDKSAWLTSKTGIRETKKRPFGI